MFHLLRKSGGLQVFNVSWNMFFSAFLEKTGMKRPGIPVICQQKLNNEAKLLQRRLSVRPTAPHSAMDAGLRNSCAPVERRRSEDQDM